MALNFQVINVPFSSGLFQKVDDRTRPQPFLDICRDVSFDEAGGLQTRLPYDVAAGAIFGGGTIANARRIARVGTERVLFTDTQVYSWNAQLSAWVMRGTHLAVALDEQAVFTTPADQIDGDRAELAGTIVYAWTEGTQVFAAALDKVTGSVLVSPTAVSTAVGRPRLVALTTKILLFTDAGSNNLTVRAIDPAAPATAIGGAGSSALATNYNAFYDVVRVAATDTAVVAVRRVTTSSYSILKVTAALAVTAATPARIADGPIAVSVDPNGTNAQIVRTNGTNVQGDLVTVAGLADVFTAQAVGTIPISGTGSQIAAAHRSVQNGGAFRCYVWWTTAEVSTGAGWVCKFNWVDTANALGTQATFLEIMGIASRAFDYAGQVYLWLGFGRDSVATGDAPLANLHTEAQNAYYLYRDDALLAAKSAYDRGGGVRPNAGILPGVALTAGTTTYSWCGTERRQIAVGTGTAFAARAPLDVAFTFDSNRARRTATLGRTLYIAGGEILQYDGTRLAEVGFHVTPWQFTINKTGTGAVDNGLHGYKLTFRWVNARGESERSSTAASVALTMATGPAGNQMVTWFPLVVTHKNANPPAAEVWRTALNPSADAPFFLVSSNDPAVTTNPNRYVANDPTLSVLPTFRDEMADAVATTLEANPENGGALEDLAPPAATIIIATDTRLFLAGVAGDPHRIWYSKQRLAGQVAAFHDDLTIDVPRDGGDITSIAFLDDVLFAFRATAIYALPGQGLDNTGQGQNFGPARIVSLDVGAVNHESVALTPQGLIFKSSKGWQLLHGNGALEFIGDKVSDFDAEAVLAVTVVETTHEVRILTAARMLVWNYRLNQWGEWTVSSGVHACMFDGAHVYLTASGTRTQLTSYSGIDYGIDVETAWIKLADLQGATRCRRLQTLGEFRSACYLRHRVAYNYLQSAGAPVYADDKAWPASPAVVGGPLQVKHGPKRPQCESIKLRLTAVAAGVQASIATASGFSEGTVATSGTAWAATFRAKIGNSDVVGELGNVVTLAITFELGTATLIDVRDDAGYDFTLGWQTVTSRVGVRVVCAAGALTVAALEAAIAAGSARIELAAADVTPGKTLDIATLATHIFHGALAGGTFVAPAGDAVRLTSLELEVGGDPGLYRRLPAAQQQ